MFFFKKKRKTREDLQRNPFYNERDTLVVYFRCDKCGEVFRSHLRKGYDFIVNYDNPSIPYRIDKLYVGSKCPNRIELRADFKSNYKPVSVEIEGATFITKEEYEEEMRKEGEKR